MPGATAADRGRQVRGKLIDAARQLIAERGWTGVSTRILAQRAGVAAGLVHYHFGSVQAVLREAATSSIRDVLGEVGSAISRADGPDQALADLLTGLDAYSGTDPTSLLFAESYLAATRDRQLREELTGLLDDFRRQVADWLGDAGVSRPADTAATLAAVLDGVMLHRALDPALTSARVHPVLRRLLQDTHSDEEREITTEQEGASPCERSSAGPASPGSPWRNG